ncbi:MBL fold metallo-hydrolase [Clostridium sp. CTA-5]
MNIKKVKGNTFCIDTGMTNIPFYKITEEKIIMLDSGWIKEREGIDEILSENNFKVESILCTHAHIDHIGNNAYLKEKYNCIISMPAYEALVCTSNVNLKLYYNSPTLLKAEKHFGHMVCKTDITISNEMNEICINDVKFKIIHTPGHSPEHICIITPDNVAYLGDALISYEVMKSAKMPYALILSEDLKSKEKLYKLKCNDYIVSHKGIYKHNKVKKLISDNIDFYENRAKSIYKLIYGKMTFEEIFKTVVKKFNIPVRTQYKYFILERMLKSYVEYLNERGYLELNIEDGFLKYSKSIKEQES